MKSPNKRKVRRRAEMGYRRITYKVKFAGYEYMLMSGLLPAKGDDDSAIDGIVEVVKKDAMFGDGFHLNQRFLEWQAALNVLTDRALFGTGTGSYRREIRSYYQLLPKLNSMEPDSQNSYFVILFTMGMAGLGAFIWILCHYTRAAIDIYDSAGESFARGLSFGLLGSITAFSMNNLFSAIVNHAAVIQFVLVPGIIDILRSVTFTGLPAGKRDRGIMHQ